MLFFEEAKLEAAKAIAQFPDQEENVSLEGWLSILVEEVGEVARELNEDLNARERGEARPETPKRLREELIQVAAMAERMAFAVRLQLEVQG